MFENRVRARDEAAMLDNWSCRSAQRLEDSVYTGVRVNPADADGRRAVARTCAADTLGSDQRATEWLEAPHGALAGARPVDVVAASVEGLRRVLTVLGRIDHGIGF